jgi:hypothetical protein
MMMMEKAHVVPVSRGAKVTSGWSQLDEVGMLHARTRRSYAFFVFQSAGVWKIWMRHKDRPLRERGGGVRVGTYLDKTSKSLTVVKNYVDRMKVTPWFKIKAGHYESPSRYGKFVARKTKSGWSLSWKQCRSVKHEKEYYPAQRITTTDTLAEAAKALRSYGVSGFGKMPNKWTDLRATHLRQRRKIAADEKKSKGWP